MTPLSPPANPTDDDMTWIAYRISVVEDIITVPQFVPFQRRMAPPVPTTYPSVAETMDRPFHDSEPVSTNDAHVVPFQRYISPILFPNQPSLALTMSNDVQVCAPVSVCNDQVLPFQR